MLKVQIPKPDTFLYFAYGGNMLEFRIHMHTPSAEFVSIGRLDNYRLDFMKYCHFWGGPSGTLVPTANAHVWGVIWRIDTNDLISLDDEKGVDTKKYYIVHLDVLTPYVGILRCRTYIQRVNPLPRGDNGVIPVEQWPSWAYKQVLMMGAKEHGIPRFYIDWLKSLQDNGEEGWLRAAVLLRRYALNPPCECRVPGRYPRAHLKCDVQKKRKENEKKEENEEGKEEEKEEEKTKAEV